MLGKVFGHDLAKAADPQAIALLWQLHQAGIAMAAMQLRYAHDEHQP
jgi:hypothetical protein